MKKAKPHVTARTIIKTANIDTKMVPVVNWLNRFESVVTKFCCQGGQDFGGKKSSPYVVFACDDPVDLMNIVNKVSYVGKVVIRPPSGIRLMDYSIDFLDEHHLKIFKERL
jgi:hypothetical protein